MSGPAWKGILPSCSAFLLTVVFVLLSSRSSLPGTPVTAGTCSSTIGATNSLEFAGRQTHSLRAFTPAGFIWVVTVQTNPLGRSFSVDGTTYTSRQTFLGGCPSGHVIATTTPQDGGTGIQYVWSNWSDGGAISHYVDWSGPCFLPYPPPTIITANFNTQYYLTMNAGAGGTVSPASGWYDSGQSLQIQANPNDGYRFFKWTGSGSGSYSGTANPASVTMNTPITERASFATGIWSTAGSLNTARSRHTATLLPNGEVLVAGGLNGNAYLASAEVYSPATGIWSTGGSLAAARVYHTATLLPNGKVLVAGGYGNGDSPASAELYDPATPGWSVTGSLASARYAHTATLLPNGKVLVAGGYGNGSYLATAELYDPATSMWSGTGSFATARFYHTATLLPNGKVLVAGGYNGSYLASAVLYDPATGTWIQTGSLATARYAHTATLLPDGKVLVAGGYGNGDCLASAELYDPATGTWSNTGSLDQARQYHTATLLPNGKVLVTGGYDGDSLASAELYDFTTATWDPAGSLATARYLHTATLLPSGIVLVAGGAGSGDLASAELYDPAIGAWINTGSLAAARNGNTATLLPSGKVLVAEGGNSSSELYDPVSGTWSATGSLVSLFASAMSASTATLLPNGKVLIAGGWFNWAQSDTELYDPATGTWSASGSLIGARAYHTATLLPNGKVLAAGGSFSIFDFKLATAELYDPATGTWSTTGPLATARFYHTATLLPNGKVLVVGGYGSSALSSVELYDPATGTWSATGSLITARYGHTATLLPNGKVLVAGGDTSGGYLANAELYDPATGTWSAAGSLITARYGHTATLLPSGKVLVAGGHNGAPAYYLATAELYDPATDTWSAAASLATARDNQTATLLPNGKVLVAGGGGGAGSLASAELYDSGLGFNAAWQPLLNSVTSRLSFNSKLIALGSGFKGISEASGGNAQASNTNYPLVQLRSLANEQTRFLLSASGTWSDTSFESVPVTDFPIGHALVTVFTNGIPSISKIINVQRSGPFRADFDGDGKSDIAVYRPTTGQWFTLNSSSGYSSYQIVGWGMANDRPVAGDFDGDGKADIAVYRPSTGQWFILKSSTGYSYTDCLVIPWGNPSYNDQPVTGDFDGDGKTDIAIYRPGTGQWFILKSSSGYSYSDCMVVTWGNLSFNDQPIVGDFDGDGKADIGVYRPGTGQWLILQSSAGYSYSSCIAITWGDSAFSDQPVVGDFDGDGKADIAVYRPTSGTWFILKSSAAYSASSCLVFGWGDPASNDQPIVGDFDGDGIWDITVYRPTTGQWFVLKSSTGNSSYLVVGWGNSAFNDQPLSSRTGAW